MKYLIDTCIFLWIIGAPDRLPQKVVDIWEDPDNEVFVSVLALCELGIKRNKGYDIPSFEDLMWQATCHEIEIISLIKDDIELLENLEDIHRDPFDRLLITQALNRGATIITSDKCITRYPVKTVWD